MSKMTKRQKIDAAHETRMWVKDVIIPAITAAVFIDRLNPMLKYDIRDKYVETKNRLKEKFTKKDKESQ